MSRVRKALVTRARRPVPHGSNSSPSERGRASVSETTLSSTETATIDEVVTTVIMSRVTDFFGFFVYGIASALVFPRLFFPSFDQVTGTLLSFAIFLAASSLVSLSLRDA